VSPGLTGHQWSIADPGRDYLVYSAAGDSVRLDLSRAPGEYLARWIEPKSGQVRGAPAALPGGREVEFRSPATGPAVLWVSAAVPKSFPSASPLP
jgi:hypothetical protein